MQRANLLSVVDEGEKHGFDWARSQEMYFEKAHGFLNFMVATSQKLLADMRKIEDQGEELAAGLPADQGRFLLSHVVAQATMLRMMATLAEGVSRAAMAFASWPHETRPLLETALTNTEAARAQWYGRYEGRFRDWPVGKMLIDIGGKLSRIRHMISTPEWHSPKP